MASSTLSNHPQQPQPGPSGPPPQPAYIHILIGKVRRPQQQQEKKTDAPPPPPEYDSLWATFHMHRSTISYEGFQAAVSASANEVVAAAQQLQPEDKAAVTVFSPIGQYTLHHVTPQPPNPQPNPFNPPPTSLLTLPSRQTPPDPKRPIWVDFYIHSNNPHPKPAGPDDNQTKFTSELKTRLRTLDAKLSNGPGRRNTLGLAEIPAAALQVSQPNPNSGGDGDGGPLVLIPPPISRRDWACAVEMYLLATTLNGLAAPDDPSLQLMMHEAVTQLGRLRDPRLLCESFGELLLYLGEGSLCLAYADEAVAAAMEGSTDATVGGDDDDDETHVSRFTDVDPGFMALMLAFLEEDFFSMAEDEERVLLQDVRARRAGLG